MPTCNETHTYNTMVEIHKTSISNLHGYCLSFSTGCLCLHQLLPVILHRVPLSIPTIACHSQQGASVYTNYCLSFSTGCLCLYQLLPVILHRVPLSIPTIACHYPQGASVYKHYCLSFSTGRLCLYQLLPVILHRVLLSIPTIACHSPQGTAVYTNYCLSFSTPCPPCTLLYPALSIPTWPFKSPAMTTLSLLVTVCISLSMCFQNVSFSSCGHPVCGA